MELEKEKTKLEEKLAKTERKLEELKNNLVQDRKRKADLMANLILKENEKDKKELAEITKNMVSIEADIAIFPDIIVILKGKIEAVKSEMVKRDSLITQKKREKDSKKIFELSQKFYEDLKSVKASNDLLRQEEQIFREKWGNLPSGKGITIGSYDSLKALWETIQKEMLGQGRQTIPFGNLPNFRI